MLSLAQYVFHDAFVARGDLAFIQRRVIDTEVEAFARLRVEYEVGNLTDDTMVAFHDQYAAITGAGYATRWDAGIGDVFSHADVEHHRDCGDRHRPNMSHGGFVGVWPIDREAPRPSTWQPVVYLLYDAAGDLCYIGSTKDLAERLKSHVKDGKRFVRWEAHPCADRDLAFLREEELLQANIAATGRLPYLNRKAGH